jgi:serine/threonine protein kinase
LPSLVGQTLEHYRLVEEVGAGGMAMVYRAIDTRTQQEVALKVLAPAIGAERRFIQRFRREAEIMHRRLKHPNIIPVLGYGEVRGIAYLAMPFVRGGTLHDRIASGQITPEGSRRWVAQVAAALDFAHRRGVIHRDIKPSNVMIDEKGNALLADFGLARLVEGTGTLTGSMLMGTPAFVSPEQGRGAQLDGRSDQYSLGIILYQIATGRLPFDADTPMATVLMHISEPVPRPRSLNPDLSPTVEAVILKSLEKDPTRRFPTVTALSDAYQAALAGAPLAALEEPTLLSMALPAHAGRERPAFENRTLARERRTSTLMPILLGLVGSLVLVGALLSPPALNFFRGLFAPVPTPGLPLPATAATPVTILVGTTPTSPSGPTATPVLSQGCPALQMIDFRRADNAVQWVIDNGTDQALALLDWSEQGFQDNPLVSFSLGNNTLWQLPPGVTPGPEATFTIPRDDRSTIPAHSTRPIRLVFSRADTAPGYSFDLVFGNNCTLSTTW